VLLPKRYQFKIGGSCVEHWDYAHPLGCLGTAVAARRLPSPRKGLEGREAAAAQGRRPCGAAEPPQSPVFGAAEKAPEFLINFVMVNCACCARLLSFPYFFAYTVKHDAINGRLS
jgi:hypothetical protein